MGKEVYLDDRAYVRSGVWKCRKSPTGAHFYRRMTQTKKLHRDGYFICQYCNDVRQFPTTWAEASELLPKGASFTNLTQRFGIWDLGLDQSYRHPPSSHKMVDTYEGQYPGKH